MELYFYSAQAYYINKIINRTEEDSWVHIEDHQLGAKNLFIALFTKRKIKNASFVSNSTIKAWEKIKNILGMKIAVPKTTYLWNNPSISIQKQQLKWGSWSDKGVTTIGDLISDTNIKPFKQLVTEFNLTNKEFLRYFQLRNWITDNLDLSPSSLDTSDKLKLFLIPDENKKIIGKVYKYLIEEEANNYSLQRIYEGWDQDLNITTSNTKWKECLGSTNIITPFPPSVLNVADAMKLLCMPSGSVRRCTRDGLKLRDG